MNKRKLSVAYSTNIPLTSKESEQRLSQTNDERSIEDVKFLHKKRKLSAAFTTTFPKTSNEYNQRIY